jgi:hypothetical protein
VMSLKLRIRLCLMIPRLRTKRARLRASSTISYMTSKLSGSFSRDKFDSGTSLPRVDLEGFVHSWLQKGSQRFDKFDTRSGVESMFAADDLANSPLPYIRSR